MTDSHCHVANGADRYLVCPLDWRNAGDAVPVPAGAPPVPSCAAVRFYGTHPWFSGDFDPSALSAVLAADPSVGVGEIGLDRLRSRVVSPEMRSVFIAQLEIAAAFRRPVVLHGAKCWGEVVRECKPFAGRIPAFLFHGFSRSPGLLPEMSAIGGFVSLGPALLNDHAVNYRRLAAEVPDSMLLVETDRTAETAASVPPVRAVAEKLAALRGVALDALEAVLEANVSRFLGDLEKSNAN